MKKIYSTIMMLAMMVAALSFTACSSDDDNDSKETNSDLVGTWSVQSVEGWGMSEDDFYDYMQFRSDGTYIEVQEDEDAEKGYTVDKGKWTVSNNKIVLYVEVGVLAGSTFSFDIVKKEKDKITVSMWGLSSHLIRVSDDIIEKYL